MGLTVVKRGRRKRVKGEWIAERVTRGMGEGKEG